MDFSQFNKSKTRVRTDTENQFYLLGVTLRGAADAIFQELDDWQEESEPEITEDRWTDVFASLDPRLQKLVLKTLATFRGPISPGTLWGVMENTFLPSEAPPEPPEEPKTTEEPTKEEKVQEEPAEAVQKADAPNLDAPLSALTPLRTAVSKGPKPWPLTSGTAKPKPEPDPPPEPEKEEKKKKANKKKVEKVDSDSLEGKLKGMKRDEILEYVKVHQIQIKTKGISLKLLREGILVHHEELKKTPASVGPQAEKFENVVPAEHPPPPIQSQVEGVDEMVKILEKKFRFNSHQPEVQNWMEKQRCQLLCSECNPVVIKRCFEAFGR